MSSSERDALREEGWPIQRRRFWPFLVTAILTSVLLSYSFDRMGLTTVVTECAKAVAALLGEGESSQVVNSASRFIEQGWPPVISRERETNRIQNFDPDHLPWFSHMETREVPSVAIDVVDGKVVETEVRETQEVLVEPLGYLFRVAWLMLQTLEIAFWGTLIAVVIGIPLSMLGSRRLSPGRPFVVLSQGLCSLSRAIPELISALFFVLLFGFGPAAGILALGLHSAGFLGKFFADDIDNTDAGPANALASSGVGRLSVFLHALLPQVLPQYLAYVQYILERNVRTATVLGIVGAGGIGVELMGKWHNFQFGHATTVLLAIFITVVVLEALTQSLRKKWMRE
ncbi:phosphonate ABC transporter, permease protein PhnE [Blastopirellula marina]|uniref:Phosphonate ABC transporter, permease protein PhnE n=1 Tax=Blastopirellula marina TaxID=124 RepID=A0A2S8GET2_9BACT|nr:phosphonate ABC transporter, permease protein PhnE [Blastopirellula marina]PQO42820.1 phosphonate ABC transporter, permease protein PhnE [Blastopirellula marina]PTL46586.1 phosphonate ABC transporter, permease protein PhnE [Blastopirellula marina]